MATVNYTSNQSQPPNGGTAYRTKLELDHTQDVDTNASTIDWEWVLAKVSPPQNGFYGYSATRTVVINGQTLHNQSGNMPNSSWTGSSNWPLASGTIVVPHNADGTKSVTVSAVYARSAQGWAPGTMTISRTLTLPTIPRATVPTLTNSSRQIGQTTTINLPRASESFTHNITYQFGSLTGQTAGLSAHTGVGTSATFTVPTALVTEMVAQSSRTLTFTVVTMSGVTVVGSKTVQLTVTPANGTMYQRPTVNATVVRALSDGTPDDDGECAKVTISAAASSVLVSTEQNELNWKTEVSSDAGVSWAELGSGTVAAHGLTLNSATTYTDSDPGTGGTQPFSTTAGYLFRVTITDAFSSESVQVVQMFTAVAIVDIYDGGGDPSAAGLSVGALFNPSLGSRIQVGGSGLMRLSFPSKAALDAFTGWPGLIGFVVSENSEYVWRSGWRLWSRPATSFGQLWSNVTIGNGSQAWSYYVAGGIATVTGQLTFGSTTTLSGVPYFYLPAEVAGSTVLGDVRLTDTSAGAPGRHLGRLRVSAANAVVVEAELASGTYARAENVGATVPFTWGADDVLAFTMSYPIA